MTKLLPSLALALVASVGVALPALAESDSFDSFNSSYQLIRLHDAGVNAVSATEDTSGRMNVTIAEADGSKSTVLYDIDSLSPVRGFDEVTGSIRAKAPVVRSAPSTQVPESLVYQGDGSF